MQNAAMAALGLPWGYLAFDVAPADLRAAIEGARSMGFLGLNLTVPHKVLALGMVDVLDETARQWGAVNTLRFEGQCPDGRWQPLATWEAAAGPLSVRIQGFNTDADALVRALREDLGFESAGASALVLGTGGAGRVAALKLAGERVRRLFLVNRTREKAEAVAAEMRRQHPAVEVVIGYPPMGERVDVVVNATSLGLKPEDEPPWDGARFAWSQTGAVFDMIYRPAETRLLRAAREAGCRTVNGLGMLLYQGARALEIWSGKPAPIEVMRRALMQNVYGGNEA